MLNILLQKFFCSLIQFRFILRKLQIYKKRGPNIQRTESKYAEMTIQSDIYNFFSELYEFCENDFMLNQKCGAYMLANF